MWAYGDLCDARYISGSALALSYIPMLLHINHSLLVIIPSCCNFPTLLKSIYSLMDFLGSNDTTAELINTRGGQGRANLTVSTYLIKPFSTGYV